MHFSLTAEILTFVWPLVVFLLLVNVPHGNKEHRLGRLTYLRI